MTARQIRIVSLWIHPGQEEAFEAFEREAARNMARHGGRIDQAVRLTGAPADDATPYELHVVSFPDEAAVQAYANDPATRALLSQRAQIIARTVVMTGQEAGPY